MMYEYEIYLPKAQWGITITCQEPINLNDEIVSNNTLYKVTEKAFKLVDGDSTKGLLFLTEK